MDFWSISYLGSHDMARATCVSRDWRYEAGIAWGQMRYRAAVRIQSAMRRSLAVLKTARLLSDKYLDLLNETVQTEEDGLGIPQKYWAAYVACSYDHVQDVFGDNVQIFAAEKLFLHGMDAPAESFLLSGLGLLGSLHFTRRLTIEQLACMGI